jgi:hypothetical protein
MSEAKPSFEILRFDIRYSTRLSSSQAAVRCLIPAIEAANQIIKKPCHFGVVSHEHHRGRLKPDT